MEIHKEGSLSKIVTYLMKTDNIFYDFPDMTLVDVLHISRNKNSSNDKNNDDSDNGNGSNNYDNSNDITNLNNHSDSNTFLCRVIQSATQCQLLSRETLPQRNQK